MWQLGPKSTFALLDPFLYRFRRLPRSQGTFSRDHQDRLRLLSLQLQDQDGPRYSRQQNAQRAGKLRLKPVAL